MAHIVEVVCIFDNAKKEKFLVPKYLRIFTWDKTLLFCIIKCVIVLFSMLQKINIYI